MYISYTYCKKQMYNEQMMTLGLEMVKGSSRYYFKQVRLISTKI